MEDLLTGVNGRNKGIFFKALRDLPDKSVIQITPFTQYLRQQGAACRGAPAYYLLLIGR